MSALSQSKPKPLHTDRLVLRRWQAQDYAPFAALNADAQVMAHFPALLTRAQSDALIDRFEAHFDAHGFGPWAVANKHTHQFIGYVGLLIPSFTAHFTPCVEIGWRLARAHWGAGYATEAAHRALAFGFQELGLGAIVSFTVAANQRSRNVMRRLGMQHEVRDDFLHPALAPTDPLAHHVLYRISQQAFYRQLP